MSLPVNPKIWFDASDGSTLTSDTQGNVTNWASKGTISNINATPTGAASRTIYTRTNGGFTAAFRVRFTNASAGAERVFDFANGQANNNIVLWRNSETTLKLTIYEGATLTYDFATTTGALQTNQYANFIFRLNANTKQVQIYKDGVLDVTRSYATADAPSDRTITTCYIGRSHWTGDSYTQGDLSALYVFDRYITDQELDLINTHMANYTATPLPIYNPKVALNAALLVANTAAGTALSAWEDYAQGTAGNRPTFQLDPPRINFNRTNSQHLVASTPVVKTGRITQNGLNSVLFTQESSLITNSLTFNGSTTTRNAFMVGRNLSDVNGGATIATWSSVRYIRLQRTTSIGNDAININELEVYDALGKRIPHTMLTGTVSPVFQGNTALYGPQNLYNNIINSGIAHTEPGVGAYVEVDLGVERTISKVIIRNRYDSNQFRINGTTLYLQNTARTNISSTAINITTPFNLIFTPNTTANSQFYCTRNQGVNFFNSGTGTGTVNLRYTDHFSLTIIPNSLTNNITTATINDTEVNVFSIINDSSVGGLGNLARVNGFTQVLTASATGAYSSSAASTYTLGGVTTGGATLQICEMLIYDTVLTFSQVQQIEKYLYDKWYPQAATNIPVPRLWFDATEPTTVYADTQNSVTALVSKGNAYAISATPTGTAERLFNPASNGGFTIACRVRFSGAAASGAWERIVDFGNGQSSSNIILGRLGTSNQLLLRVHDGASIIIDVVGSATSIDTNFNNYIIRLNENPISGVRTVQFYRNNILDTTTTTYTNSFTNRTLGTCYIGRSHWATDQYLQGDICALYVFDRYISDDEMSIINTHMTNNTATPLPIYNPIVSLNAALITQTANTAISTWEDFTSSGSPTFQTNPPRIQFVRASSQHFVETLPVVKTSRLTQYGKNSLLLTPQSSLLTNSLAFSGSTSSRSVFFVGRNLTEVLGSSVTPSSWSGVRYIRLQRTTGSDALNISEIEVFDNTGAKVPNDTITPFQDSTLDPPSDFGASKLLNNAIKTNQTYEIAHTIASASTYMQLDLGSEKTISKVIIRNRYDLFKTRLAGTTLTLRRADNATIVASTAVNIAPDTLIYTPSGLIGSRYQDTELLTPTTSVTGALSAKYADYRALSIVPFGQTNPNVDSAMIGDPQVNVFSIVNDATVGNSVRINGTNQTTYYNQINAYTTTAAQYRMNYTTATEANSVLQLCEMMVYDTPLTADQVIAIQTYLIQKWHYAIAPPLPRPARPFASSNTIKYWWVLTEATKQSQVTLTLTGGPGATTVTTSAFAQQYTFSGLTNGANYSCTINALGEDNQTSAIQAYRDTQPGGIPSVPLQVSFSQPTSNSLRVVWNIPESNGGSEISWYVIQTTDKLLRYGVEPYYRDYTIVGVPAGTRTFQIQAINSVGYGVPYIGPTYSFS